MSESAKDRPPPVEHRLFGLDRRLLWPTLGILAIVLFWGGVVPAIDEAVSADEIPAGTTYTVGAGTAKVSLTPTPGWVVDGVPVPTLPSLAVYDDGITFTMTVGKFSGTPEELLDEIRDTHDDFALEGEPQDFTTPAGIPGTAVELVGLAEDGGLFALVAKNPEKSSTIGGVSSVGIQVVVEGPAPTLDDHADDIAAMIDSITVDFGGAS